MDKTYLACAHHSVMIGACGFFMDQKEIQCLLIGLGGGGLATYMTNNFENRGMKILELEPRPGHRFYPRAFFVLVKGWQ